MIDKINNEINNDLYVVAGIQQIGIGVENLVEAWKYYMDIFQWDVKILDDSHPADIMAHYMGGKPRQKRAVIAINMQGGGGVELWNHQERKPLKPEFELQLGDLGCFAAKIKSRNIKQTFEELSKKNIKILGEITKSIDNKETFFVEDIFGNIFQIVEDNYVFRDEKRSTGGFVGAMIGCTDIDKTLVVYRDILGYDRILADETGSFEDTLPLPSGGQNFRRVILTESKPRKGAFSRLFGQSYIELVQALDRIPNKIYEGRYWGDPGFIQICYDVRNMSALENKCTSLGFPFTANSAVKQKNSFESFVMGDAAGHFAYIEDPDGSLIEFVETHKIPIVKKWGIYLNLRKRNPQKPLPNPLLKMLRFARIKQEEVRNIFLLFSLLLSPFLLFAQENINHNGFNTFYYPNGVKSSEGTLVNGKPDGYWKSYNEKGVLVSEGNRKNFLLDSVWVFYAPTGEKSLEISYLEGKKHGFRKQYLEEETIVEEWRTDTLVNNIKVFYKTGELKRLTPIVEGKQHGFEKEFNKEGLVIVVSKYYAGVLGKREFINRTDKFGLKQGSWKYFWGNGNLKEEGVFQNDKKNGYFKYYDEAGNFKYVEKYAQDNLIVDAPETRQMEVKTVYHPNGKRAITATYYKGVPDGVRREFDENGKVIKGFLFSNGILRYEGITDEEGKRQGLWKEFYPTGELKSEGNYIDSKQEDSWKFYFENQKIEVVGRYKNGKKEGTWYWYYPNGEILQEENWNNGKLDGTFIEYNETGEITVKGDYLEGTEEGEWFYIQGNAIEKGGYYDGMRSGMWITKWREDGKPISEIEYDQDTYHGKYTLHHSTGKIRETGKYANGERVGIWHLYDEDGELLLTTVYAEGREIQWNDYKLPEP